MDSDYIWIKILQSIFLTKYLYKYIDLFLDKIKNKEFICLRIFTSNKSFKT
jgi:hypothetical protein